MFAKYKIAVRRNQLMYTAMIILFGATIYFVLQHVELVMPLAIEPYIIKWEATDDISCHYIEEGDAIPSAEDFSPPERSIYFLETSCRGGLNTRQACAVESAARTNADWQVNVLFTSPITEYTLARGSLAVLKTLSNVKIVRIHIKNFVKGTPLETLVGTGALNASKYRVVHTSDALRILTLYKWGGVYLDTDVVMVKSLNPLGPNWAAREDGTWVANGVLSFSKNKVGRIIAASAIRELETDYRGNEWAYNGPGLMTRARNKLCSPTTPNATTTSDTAVICDGFVIYGPEYFYPVHWSVRNEYFDPGELNPNKVKNAYGHHVWNALTKDVKISRDSPYAKLAKQYCPGIYNLYGDNFGS